MAIAGLVLGILGIVGIGGFFVPFMGIATFCFSLAALILGAICMKRAKNGIAIAALVLGIIGVVLNIPSAICGICVGAACAAAADAANASLVGLLVF